MPDDKTTKATKSLKAVASMGAPTPPKAGLGNVAAALRPEAHTAGVKPRSIKDDFTYDVASHFAFIGSGQGGSRIAQSYWDLGYRRIAAFNTTDADFEGLDPAMEKLSCNIGGAAKDMQFARDALTSRTEETRDLLVRAWGTDPDCVLVCASLGGGTGSGTALPLVKIARKYLEDLKKPPRVGAVVSLPSTADGQKTARNAVTAFHELLEAGVSPLIVIDNDRVHELYSPPMSALFTTANNLVATLLHLFNRLAAMRSPYTTFDRAEFLQLLDGGLIVMGSADIDLSKGDTLSPADISTAIKTDLANNVLASVDLKTGRKAACVFVGAQDVLDRYNKDYFEAGFSMLDRIVGSANPPGGEVVVHRGLYPGDEATQGLQCYTLVSELAPPKAKMQALVAKAAFPATQVQSIAKHLKID